MRHQYGQARAIGLCAGRGQPGALIKSAESSKLSVDGRSGESGERRDGMYAARLQCIIQELSKADPEGKGGSCKFLASCISGPLYGYQARTLLVWNK